MEIKEEIERINKKIGMDIRKEYINEDLVDFHKEGRKYTLTDFDFYDVIKGIMDDWLWDIKQKFKSVVPDYYKICADMSFMSRKIILPTIKEDTSISYPIDEIMKLYFPIPPASVFLLARLLSVHSQDVVDFYREVIIHWGCFYEDEFRAQLLKNPRDALQRHSAALLVFAKNLPAYLVMCKKTSIEEDLKRMSQELKEYFNKKLKEEQQMNTNNK